MRLHSSSHGENRGSIPLGSANKSKHLLIQKSGERPSIVHPAFDLSECELVPRRVQSWQVAPSVGTISGGHYGDRSLGNRCDCGVPVSAQSRCINLHDESDYSERELWPKYTDAYEDAVALTSTKHAPWFIIPSNHKWFRNLAVSAIIADTMDEMGLKLPPTKVEISDIRRKFHAAEVEEKRNERRKRKVSQKAA
jgi:hypothetical protein